MAVELRALDGSSYFAPAALPGDGKAVVVRDAELQPQETDMIQEMLMRAQEQLQNELELTSNVTAEKFQEMGGEMGARFEAFTQQIQMLQTALMRSEGQNRELQATQDAQVGALQAQVAAQQAQIKALEAKNAALQKGSDQRIAAEIQSKTKAVKTVQDVADSRVNALTEQNKILTAQASNLQRHANTLNVMREKIRTMADQADRDLDRVPDDNDPGLSITFSKSYAFK